MNLGRKTFTLKELKDYLMKRYYGKGYIINEFDETRPLIITEVSNRYNGEGDIVLFSVKGSPPKGEALLIKTQDNEVWTGKLFYIKHRKIIKIFNEVEITNS